MVIKIYRENIERYGHGDNLTTSTNTIVSLHEWRFNEYGGNVHGRSVYGKVVFILKFWDSLAWIQRYKISSMRGEQPVL